MRLVQAGTMLLGAVMYCFVIAFADQLIHGEPHWIFFIIGYWNTLLIVVTALVVTDSIRKARAGKTRQLSTDALVVKLAAIPFFVLNFFVLANVAIGGFVILIFGGAALLLGVWIGSGLTYLVMLSTSIYAWVAIARLRRERTIGTGLAVLYFLLSFLFVTDILAGALVFGHSRRRPGRALVSVLLATGAILIAIAFAPTEFGAFALFELDLHNLAIVGGALILATVVGILIWILTVRRRSRRISPVEAAVAEDPALEGSRSSS